MSDQEIFAEAESIPDGVDLASEIVERLTRDETVHMLITCSGLTPRYRLALEMRFGLRGGEELTLKETGHVLGVTGQRIMQIEARAKRQIRELYRSNELVRRLVDEVK